MIIKNEAQERYRLLKFFMELKTVGGLFNETGNR